MPRVSRWALWVGAVAFLIGPSRTTGPLHTVPIPVRDPVHNPVQPPRGASHTAHHELTSIYWIGHSLLSRELIADVHERLGIPLTITNFQNAWGASLAMHWDGRPRFEGQRFEGSRAIEILAQQRFDAVVLTEAVPLRTQMLSAHTVQNAARFFSLALASNPNAELYLYESWDHRRGSLEDFQTMVRRDHRHWLVSVWRLRELGYQVRLIPAAMFWARFLGSPEPRAWKTYFQDDVHPNPEGRRLLADFVSTCLRRRNESTDDAPVLNCGDWP